MALNEPLAIICGVLLVVMLLTKCKELCGFKECSETHTDKGETSMMHADPYREILSRTSETSKSIQTSSGWSNRLYTLHHY